MLILIILTFGCITFLCIGAATAVWAGVDISEDGPDIRSVIMMLAGIGIFAFSIFSIVKATDYYREKESLKPEITTFVPPQVDTIITTRNSVSDTVYIYKFNLAEK